jgi:hypothetical protein
MEIPRILASLPVVGGGVRKGIIADLEGVDPSLVVGETVGTLVRLTRAPNHVRIGSWCGRNGGKKPSGRIVYSETGLLARTEIPDFSDGGNRT